MTTIRPEKIGLTLVNKRRCLGCQFKIRDKCLIFKNKNGEMESLEYKNLPNESYGYIRLPACLAAEVKEGKCEWSVTGNGALRPRLMPIRAEKQERVGTVRCQKTTGPIILLVLVQAHMIFIPGPVRWKNAKSKANESQSLSSLSTRYASKTSSWFKQ